MATQEAPPITGEYAQYDALAMTIVDGLIAQEPSEGLYTHAKVDWLGPVITVEYHQAGIPEPIGTRSLRGHVNEFIEMIAKEDVNPAEQRLVTARVLRHLSGIMADQVYRNGKNAIEVTNNGDGV